MTGTDSTSISADWYQTRLSRHLAIVPVQAAIDYAHEHGSPPGDVEIDREPPFAGAPDFIELVTLPLLGNGQTDISGINVRVHGGWTVDSVELEFDAHWSHTLDYEVRVIGLSEPYDFPQNRVHATLRGTRGNVTAQWDRVRTIQLPNGGWTFRQLDGQRFLAALEGRVRHAGNRRGRRNSEHW